MANHLTKTAIATLLAKTAGNLTPGDLDDLLDAMSRTRVTRGPDHDRTPESPLSDIFGATVQP